MDMENFVRGFLNPLFEILNIILAVIDLAPPGFFVGVCVCAFFIMRSSRLILFGRRTRESKGSRLLVFLGIRTGGLGSQ